MSALRDVQLEDEARRDFEFIAKRKGINLNKKAPYYIEYEDEIAEDLWRMYHKGYWSGANREFLNRVDFSKLEARVVASMPESAQQKFLDDPYDYSYPCIEPITSGRRGYLIPRFMLKKNICDCGKNFGGECLHPEKYEGAGCNDNNDRARD